MLCLNQGIAQTLDRPNMLCLNRLIALTLTQPNMLLPKPTNCPNPKSTKFNAMFELCILAYSTTWTDVLMPKDFAYHYFPFLIFDICILDIIV